MSRAKRKEVPAPEPVVTAPGVVFIATFANGLFRVGAARDVELARAEIARGPGSGEIVWTRSAPSLEAAKWLAQSPYFAFPVVKNCDAVGGASLIEVVVQIEELAALACI
jgi:hypothetical protein